MNTRDWTQHKPERGMSELTRWTQDKRYGDGHDARIKVGTLRKLEADLDKTREALQRIADLQPELVRWFRAKQIAFDKVPGSKEPEDRWQRIAFSIYNDLCEADGIARAALSANQGSE